MPERFATIYRDGLFAGQVVLVTGGGTGIGRCIAHELAALEATPVLAGRREEPLRTTAAEIADAGGSCDWLNVDVRDADAVQACVTEVLTRHERLDALVNNAGGQFPAPAEQISSSGWRSVVDLNLTGTFLMSQAALTHWMGEHGGAIVSIVADMWNGFPFMAHTGAARAGVVNLTQTLAVEWAARGVRVNAVAPGFVYSSGMATYDEEVQRAAAATGRKVPLGRIGTESEVSAAVCYLLSPAAAFVTGETLRVDGGAPLARQPAVRVGETQGSAPFDGFHLARDIPEFWRSGGESAN